MKTAMMEHIQWLYEVIDNAKAQQMNADIIQAIEYVIEGAKAKLQMEKEQIVDAFDNGSEEWTAAEYSDGQHYYNHNFES